MESIQDSRQTARPVVKYIQEDRRRGEGTPNSLVSFVKFCKILNFILI